MANPIHCSPLKAKAWSPIAVVLVMIAGMMALVGILHFVIRTAAF